MATDHMHVNGDRLWNRLKAMATIGATSAGGCNRQALTDEDRDGRRQFIRWCQDAGCSVEVDQMGNVFARRAGTDPSQPPMLIGSHLDTQPTGGKFDGVYGVLAGLEVVETLNDLGLETVHPIDVVCWTNEEGARFPPAMIGSGVFAGEFTLDYGLSRPSKEGPTLGEELRRTGFDGPRPCKATAIHAAFEAHIEQGPILESENKQIGVVTGVQGMRWYDISIIGEPVHAGPTPMNARKDPIRPMYHILKQLYSQVATKGPWARLTIGDIQVLPGSRNTVPQQVVLSVDLRHPDEATLSDVVKEMEVVVSTECRAHGMDWSIKEEWLSPAITFEQNCVNSIAEAADSLGYSAMKMFSGAGHDSVYLSRVAPTAMIFVPCKGGISHNEAESASKEDLFAGCDVLLHAILERDSTQT